MTKTVIYKPGAPPSEVGVPVSASDSQVAVAANYSAVLFVPGRGRILQASSIIVSDYSGASPGAAKLSDGKTVALVPTAGPAAGAEISHTVPAGKIWRLLSARYELVTDATVSNRRTSLVIDDGATVIHRHVSNQVQAASLTYEYDWGVGRIEAAVRSGHVGDPLVPLNLPAGYRIRTITENLQAGDDYSAAFLLVEESDAVDLSRSYVVRLLSAKDVALLTLGAEERMLNLAPESANELRSSKSVKAYGPQTYGEEILSVRCPANDSIVIPLPEPFASVSGSDKGGTPAIGVFCSTLNAACFAGMLGREWSAA